MARGYRWDGWGVYQLDLPMKCLVTKITILDAFVLVLGFFVGLQRPCVRGLSIASLVEHTV